MLFVSHLPDKQFRLSLVLFSVRRCGWGPDIAVANRLEHSPRHLVLEERALGGLGFNLKQVFNLLDTVMGLVAERDLE